MADATIRERPADGEPQAAGWWSRLQRLFGRTVSRHEPALIVAGIACCSRCGATMPDALDHGDGSCLHCYWQDAAL